MSLSAHFFLASVRCLVATATAFSSTLHLWALATVDVVFGLDFVLSFFTAYVTTVTNKVIKELPLIARHYARTTLVIDVVASLPYDSFFSTLGGAAQIAPAATEVAGLGAS